MAVEHAQPDPGVSQADFRHVVGKFATGICIASTHDDGIDYAMTVSAFTSVSLDPLRVLVCVEKITRFHRAVLNAGLWAVSVLRDDAEDVSRWFAEKGRPTQRQFADYQHSPAPVSGMPVLDSAMAVVECRTVAVYDGGDHDILLGEVIGVFADPHGGQPLLYFEGKYRTLD